MRFSIAAHRDRKLKPSYLVQFLPDQFPTDYTTALMEDRKTRVVIRIAFCNGWIKLTNRGKQYKKTAICPKQD